MQEVKQGFIELALKYNVLKFGEFTLKSGRVSPYFFNTGLFQTGNALALLGKSYAGTIRALNIKFDTLFGPAYKGIPLVSATAIQLAQNYNMDVPYSFDRKEKKTHGEKSMIVGAPLKGKVLILDDVITQGTAKRQAIELIKSKGAEVAGILIAMDRQEKGAGEKSAIQEIIQEFNIPIYSIITLEDLLQYTQTNSQNNFQDLQKYQQKYGVAV